MNIRNKTTRKSNSSETIKATIAFGIASFAINGINYLTTPIFTRILSTSEFGVVSIYNSWLQIVYVFASIGLIYPGIVNVGLYEHADNRWEYLSKILGIITASSLVLFLLFIVFRSHIASFVKLGDSLIILMILYCLFTSATSLWTTKQKYEYNYKLTVTVTIGTAIIAQVVSVASVLLLRKNDNISLVHVRLWSAGLVNILVGIIIYFYIIRQGKHFVDLDMWKSTVIVATPLIPHYLSWVVLQTTDKIMIGQMVGDDKAGIYALAATVSSIGILFWRALSTTFSPFVNTCLGEKKFKEINEVVKPLLVVVCIMCFIGALIAPEIIKILATDDYLAGKYVIPPVVISIYCHALYEVFASVSFFHKKSVRIMISSVIAAIVNLALNYICIKKYGYIAAGYTTLIANFVIVSIHYYNMRKIEPQRIITPIFVLLSVIFLTGICLSCNLLYDVPDYIRYFLTLLSLGVMFFQKNKTINAIKKMKV